MLKFIAFATILFAIVINESQSRPEVITTFPAVITLPLQTPQGSASFYPIDKLRTRRDTKPKPSSSESVSEEKNVKPTTPKADAHHNSPAGMPGTPTKSTDIQQTLSVPPKAAPPTTNSGNSANSAPPAAGVGSVKPGGTTDKPASGGPAAAAAAAHTPSPPNLTPTASGGTDSPPSKITPPIGAASVAAAGEKTLTSDPLAPTRAV